MTSTHRPCYQSASGIWIPSLDRAVRGQEIAPGQQDSVRRGRSWAEWQSRAERMSATSPPWQLELHVQKVIFEPCRMGFGNWYWIANSDNTAAKACSSSLEVASSRGQACYHGSQSEDFLALVFLVAHLFPLISIVSNLQKISLRICMVCYCLFILGWYTHIYTYMPISTTGRNSPTSNIEHDISKRCTGCNRKQSQKTQITM